MEREYSVYCHTFPNGKKYIGISCECEKSGITETDIILNQK